jgi:hypothetical protein
MSNTTYKGAKVSIELVGTTGTPTVRFDGVINDVNPGVYMDPLLDEVHKHLTSQRLAHVIADLTSLSFMNSSGIKALIKWVTRQAKEPASVPYRITLRYSNAVAWQQSSIKVVALLAKNVVTMESV